MELTGRFKTPESEVLPYLFNNTPKAQMASKHLGSLGIVEPKLVQEILQKPKLTEALFGFIYKLKTDKIKADKNLGGLFLKMNGLQ